MAAEVTNLTPACKLWQLIERFKQHSLIAQAVVRRTEGAANRMIDERGARRRDFAHDVMGRADHQCRYALAFDDMGNETDGLMAEGSIGNQQREIDLGLL